MKQSPLTRDTQDAREQAGSARSEPTESEVSGELERILADPLFQGARQLSAFLHFVVSHTLAGKSDQLKEFVIGVEVLNRGAGFNPREDPAARIVAGRVRSKLAEYYQGPGRNDPVIIALPKGGYVPVFERSSTLLPTVEQTSDRHPILSSRSIFAAIVIAFLISVIVLVASNRGASRAGLWLWRGGEDPLPRVVPLTSSAGIENTPSFSPDGNQVVFAWSGEKQDNWDLYVKMIGSATALRLTTDPALDWFPAWSRDGRQIAFLKYGQPTAIYLISPLGGPEQKIADFDAAPGAPAWSPDGRFLVTARSHSLPRTDRNPGALYLIPTQSGEPRPLLIPDSGRYLQFPAFDPSGRSLAFAACGNVGPTCDISLVGLNTAFLPQGRPRKIRNVPAELAGLAWAADGRSLLYSAGTSINNYFLWRFDVATAEASQLEIASAGAMFPAVAWKGRRLAFARQLSDQDIWRVEFGRKPKPFLVSSMLDLNAQFSPDGRRIAFASARGIDRVAIWLSDANGGNLVQLTSGPGTYDGSPRWSPDGRWIAFDVLGNDGRRSVHVVASTGGQSRHLTSGFSWSNKVPSWSRDGKSIYFNSDRTGRWEIWRLPAQGGTAEQITSNGGYVSLESVDGKTLYYTKKGYYAEEPLYARSLNSGEERQVLEGVAGRGFDVFEDGVYYRTATGPREAEIRFHEFATGRSRTVSAIEGPQGLGLSVSPNRKTILFTKFASAGIDLMLIENLR